jgi:hypothetical protein
MASKSTTTAKYVYAPLVMVSLGHDERHGNPDFHCGSIDTNFDPPQFPLDSNFKRHARVQKNPKTEPTGKTFCTILLHELVVRPLTIF